MEGILDLGFRDQDPGSPDREGKELWIELALIVMFWSVLYPIELNCIVSHHIAVAAFAGILKS